MSEILEPGEFIRSHGAVPLVDVRSPTEFERGHIPGANNIPLFSDDERALVGTAYAQQGRSQALKVGLDVVGPKLSALGESVLACAARGSVRVYCSRGGMRSRSVAWLAGLYGCRTLTLRGGYKTFRNYVLDALQAVRRIVILGGYTGTGKTEILHALAGMGQQTIDLEGLAKHQGSAFGNLGRETQPTQQQFENELAIAWLDTASDGPVWLESESRRIGALTIPEEVWRQMSEAVMVFLEMPIELRIRRLVADYGAHPPDRLKLAVTRIERRLGGLQTKSALEAIDDGNLAACCGILLHHYYDKTYQHLLECRAADSVAGLQTDNMDPVANARMLHDWREESR